METINTILDYSFELGGHTFHVSKLFWALTIMFLAWMIVLIGSRILDRVFRKKNADEGRIFAFRRLLRYFVYTIGLVLAIQSTGVDITVLIAGSAALFVGIGIGLQQTFNDLISGIILLFEDSVNVGDVIEVDGMVAKVKHIGVRTSEVETRDKVVIVVPNSKIAVNNVINWTHTQKDSMYSIDIGVAYGSDVELVRTVLLEVASEEERILKRPKSKVRFTNFGDSSLDFQLYFSSSKIDDILDIQSDLRFAIDKKFRENKISIPFPQQDIYIKEMPKK